MEFFNEYKDYITPHIGSIIRAFSSFIIAIGVVYLLGRMLNIIKTVVQKNAVAAIFIVLSNLAYSLLFTNITSGFVLMWDVALFSCISIVLYVLIGFKLYDRVDNLLDVKVSDDKKKKKETSK